MAKIDYNSMIMKKAYEENKMLKYVNNDILYNKRKEPLEFYVMSALGIIEKMITNIKIVGWEFNNDPMDYETGHIQLHNKYKEVVNSLNASDLDELKVTFAIQLNKDIDVQYKTITIFLPHVTDDCYYIINGKKSIPSYHLADTSTFVKSGKNSRPNIILKPFSFEISKPKNYEPLVDIEGEIFEFSPLLVHWNKRTVRMIHFAIAPLGITNGLKECLLYKVINVDTWDVISKLDSSLYVICRINDWGIALDRRSEQDLYASGCFYDLVYLIIKYKPKSVDEIESSEFWMEAFASEFLRYTDLPKDKRKENIENGRKYFISMFYAIFEVHINDIKFPRKIASYYKASTIRLFYWIFQNYKDILNKEQSIDYLKITINEYISHVLRENITKQIRDKHLNESMSKTKDTDYLDRFFKYLDNKNLVINVINNISLIRTEDISNGATYYSKLRMSFKGPMGIPDKTKNLNKEAYAIRPDLIGAVDYSAMSTSQPGLSGLLVPWVETVHGGSFFNDNTEPCEWFYDYIKIYNRNPFKVNYVEPIEKGKYIECKPVNTKKRIILSMFGSDDGINPNIFNFREQIKNKTKKDLLSQVEEEEEGDE